MVSPVSQPGATSGDSGFIVSGGDLFRQAALACNAIDRNTTAMDPQLQADFMMTANMLIRAWRNAGMHLWKEREAVLFPAVGQVRYNLSLGSADHFAIQYFQGVSTATVAGGSVIPCLTSGVDANGVAGQMNAGDQIGILLDSGALYWSTVKSLTAAAVTINGIVPGQASTGAAIFTYTAASAAAAAAGFARPMMLLNRRRRNVQSTIEVPIDHLARRDWDDIPYKAQVGGTIFRSYFDLQREAAYLNVNQPPSSITDIVAFVARLPIEDFVVATNNPDLPEEWYLALLWNMAKERMFGFNVPAQRRAEIKTNAEYWLANVMTEDREEESVFFAPNFN